MLKLVIRALRFTAEFGWSFTPDEFRTLRRIADNMEKYL